MDLTDRRLLAAIFPEAKLIIAPKKQDGMASSIEI
jgi:hypothetical protein